MLAKPAVVVVALHVSLVLAQSAPFSSACPSVTTIYATYSATNYETYCTIPASESSLPRSSVPARTSLQSIGTASPRSSPSAFKTGSPSLIGTPKTSPGGVGPSSLSGSKTSTPGSSSNSAGAGNPTTTTPVGATHPKPTETDPFPTLPPISLPAWLTNPFNLPEPTSAPIWDIFGNNPFGSGNNDRIKKQKKQKKRAAASSRAGEGGRISGCPPPATTVTSTTSIFNPLPTVSLTETCTGTSTCGPAPSGLSVCRPRPNCNNPPTTSELSETNNSTASDLYFSCGSSCYCYADVATGEDPRNGGYCATTNFVPYNLRRECASNADCPGQGNVCLFGGYDSAGAHFYCTKIAQCPDQDPGTVLKKRKLGRREKW